MSSSFDDTGEMRDALEDVTNVKSSATKPVKPADSMWENRVPLNYDALNATGDEAKAFEQQGIISSWASTAAKYDWNDEFGDVGPEIPELEQALFSKTYLPSLGTAIENLQNFHVTAEGPVKVNPIQKFEHAGLHPVMLSNVQKSRYLFPTPVQAYTIPGVLAGKDVIAVAQTGSGKTAAYLIPVISKLMGKAKKLAAPRPSPATWTPDQAVRAEPLVLVLCPTRELAIQIFDEARRLCYRSMLRPGVLYGGAPKKLQVEDLQHGCDILIGTAGRIADILETSPRWLSLRRLKFTILDEADEMLDSDWEVKLKPILMGSDNQDDGDHQFLMFSATFPKEARQLARNYLADDHIRVRIGRAGSTHLNVAQFIVWTDDDKKNIALFDLIVSLPPTRTLVFVNAIPTCERIDDFLFNAELPVTSLHSNRTQREREDAIRSFRMGTCPIMVATAVSARGLDVKNIMHVINFDLPTTSHGGIHEYVHRIGRTGRIGNKGRATSFYNDRNSDIAEDLCKILLECKQEIPEFMDGYKPADGVITWDDDTDNEGEDEKAGVNGSEDGWGSTTNETATHETAENAYGNAWAAGENEEASVTRGMVW